MTSNGKRLTTKVVGLDDTFNLDMWKGPIRIRELGDIAPEIPAVQSVRNQNILSSKADLEILFSFPRKAMNTKG
jgi:hypothetical protein